MTTPIGYKVHIDQTQTQGQWKAKIGRDDTGNKEITFFRRENKPGLAGKLSDLKKNVMDGEKAAKKYLQGQFKTHNGSEVLMKISQTRVGSTKENNLKEYFDKFETAKVKELVEHNSELPSPDFISGRDNDGIKRTLFTVDFIKP